MSYKSWVSLLGKRWERILATTAEGGWFSRSVGGIWESFASPDLRTQNREFADAGPDGPTHSPSVNPCDLGNLSLSLSLGRN